MDLQVNHKNSSTHAPRIVSLNCSECGARYKLSADRITSEVEYASCLKCKAVFPISYEPAHRRTGFGRWSLLLFAVVAALLSIFTMYGEWLRQERYSLTVKDLHHFSRLRTEESSERQSSSSERAMYAPPRKAQELESASVKIGELTLTVVRDTRSEKILLSASQLSAPSMRLETLTLSNPPRFVIDILGTSITLPELPPTLQGDAYFRNLRSGHSPERSRLVFDLQDQVVIISNRMISSSEIEVVLARP